MQEFILYDLHKILENAKQFIQREADQQLPGDRNETQGRGIGKEWERDSEEA